MKHPLQRFYLLFIAALISGCAAQPYLDRAVIRNESGGPISDVRVRHEPTGTIGEVHFILPYSALEVGFAPGPMKAERSIVTWLNQEGKTRRVEIELPRNAKKASKERSQTLVYTITREGNVTVVLEEQDAR